MKNFKLYFNTFYRPAFIILNAGLMIFSLTICILAANLRAEALLGESDIVYRYPQLIEKAIFPIYILLPVTFAIDMNERKKRS